MKKIFLPLSVALCGMILLGACRKKNNEYVTNHYLITGTWTVAETGIDLNKNSIVDTGEVFPLTGERAQVSFNWDGTGEGKVAFGYFDLTSGFNWGLSDQQQALWIAHGNDTSFLSVVAVDAQSMTLLNHTVTVYGNNTWQIFTKQ